MLQLSSCRWFRPTNLLLRNGPFYLPHLSTPKNGPKMGLTQILLSNDQHPLPTPGHCMSIVSHLDVLRCSSCPAVTCFDRKIFSSEMGLFYPPQKWAKNGPNPNSRTQLPAAPTDSWSLYEHCESIRCLEMLQLSSCHLFSVQNCTPQKWAFFHHPQKMGQTWA